MINKFKLKKNQWFSLKINTKALLFFFDLRLIEVRVIGNRNAS
jgi:hypothetical protein